MPEANLCSCKNGEIAKGGGKGLRKLEKICGG